METKFIRIDYNNNPATTAQTEEHRKIIEDQAKDGYFAMQKHSKIGHVPPPAARP